MAERNALLDVAEFYEPPWWLENASDADEVRRRPRFVDLPGMRPISRIVTRMPTAATPLFGALAFLHDRQRGLEMAPAPPLPEMAPDYTIVSRAGEPPRLGRNQPEPEPEQSNALLGVLASLDQGLTGGLAGMGADLIPGVDGVADASMRAAKDFAPPRSLARDLIAMPQAFAGAVPGALGRTSGAIAPSVRSSVQTAPAKAENALLRVAQVGDDIADARQAVVNKVREAEYAADRRLNNYRARRDLARKGRADRRHDALAESTARQQAMSLDSAIDEQLSRAARQGKDVVAYNRNGPTYFTRDEARSISQNMRAKGLKPEGVVQDGFLFRDVATGRLLSRSEALERLQLQRAQDGRLLSNPRRPQSSERARAESGERRPPKEPNQETVQASRYELSLDDIRAVQDKLREAFEQPNLRQYARRDPAGFTDMIAGQMAQGRHYKKAIADLVSRKLYQDDPAVLLAQLNRFLARRRR